MNFYPSQQQAAFQYQQQPPSLFGAPSLYQQQAVPFDTYGGGGFGGQYGGGYDQFDQYDNYGGAPLDYGYNEQLFPQQQIPGGNFYDLQSSAGYSFDLEPVGYGGMANAGFQNLNLGYSFENRPRQGFGEQEIFFDQNYQNYDQQRTFKPIKYPTPPQSYDNFAYFQQLNQQQQQQPSKRSEKKSKAHKSDKQKVAAPVEQSQKPQTPKIDASKVAVQGAGADFKRLFLADSKLVELDPKLYNRNYIVKPNELQEIRKHFEKVETINLNEFVTLSSRICPMPNIEQLAEQVFNEIDVDQNGKLDFDGCLVAYAFVRYKKHGGADIGGAAVAPVFSNDFNNEFNPASFAAPVGAGFNEFSNVGYQMLPELAMPSMQYLF